MRTITITKIRSTFIQGMRATQPVLATTALFCFSAALHAQQSAGPLGEFENQNDVGQVLHAGSAEYDAANKTYTVSGSGDNMWFATDDFHFVWKKISAEDVALQADISILTSEGNNHRKGALMIRQSLDTDSAYVDAARHAEGLTSLQFRPQKGANTNEIEANVSGPARLRLEKQGDRFYMWISSEGGDMQFAGGSARVEIQSPFYVGLAVTAHDKDATTQVAFRNVELQTSVPNRNVNYSTLETVLQSGDARSGYVAMEHLTAPGWSADGHALTYMAGREQQQAAFTPLRTAAPIGAPMERHGDDTSTYFTKKRAGYQQIWRKPAAGGAPEQLTSGESNNVMPSLSPDGKTVVFLSYGKGAHFSRDRAEVSLRLMNLTDKKVKTLVTFVGGRGSLGLHPWSPDGKRLVFASYQSLK